MKSIPALTLIAVGMSALAVAPAPLEVFPILVESPAYPILAVQARIAGEVVLEVAFDKAARVAGIQRVSGHPLLAEAAEATLRKWRFAYRVREESANTRLVNRFKFKYVLEGTANGRPRSRFVYEYPGTVIVVGESMHYQPEKGQ